MEYKCKICDKNYSSYQSLWIHNKKFHNTNEVVCGSKEVVCGSKEVVCGSKEVVCGSKEVVNKKYNCAFCNKQFNDRSNKYKHEKRCKEKDKPVQQITPIQQINNNNNTNITNNTTNNTTNNQQNIIVIQQLGHEKISDFTIKEISKIINSGNNSPFVCTELLHFNKKRPQYQSICNTSLEGKYFNIIDTNTQTPIKVNKDEHNDKILLNSVKYINNIQLEMEFDKEFADKFNSEEKQKMMDIINNTNKYFELKNKKIHYTFLNEISYNFKEIVKNTWKCLQPLEEESDDEDGLSEELYKKYQMDMTSDTDDSEDSDK
jgi:hypothetical protein